LLFIHVTSAVCATAGLTVLDGVQPTVFDDDVDMGFRVWNRLKMYCFTDLRTFFTWWSHVNIHIAKAVRYGFMLLNLPTAKIFLQKNPNLTRFFINKPSHPDGLKINRSGWTNLEMGALFQSQFARVWIEWSSL